MSISIFLKVKYFSKVFLLLISKIEAKKIKINTKIIKQIENNRISKRLKNIKKIF